MHFRNRDGSRQRDADAVQEWIARGEHADGTPGERRDLGHAGVERRWPLMRFALDKRTGEFEVALAAEHELGGSNGALGLVAETRYTVFADADDGEPCVAGGR